MWKIISCFLLILLQFSSETHQRMFNQEKNINIKSFIGDREKIKKNSELQKVSQFEDTPVQNETTHSIASFTNVFEPKSSRLERETFDKIKHSVHGDIESGSGIHTDYECLKMSRVCDKRRHESNIMHFQMEPHKKDSSTSINNQLNNDFLHETSTSRNQIMSQLVKDGPGCTGSLQLQSEGFTMDSWSKNTDMPESMLLENVLSSANDLVDQEGVSISPESYRIRGYKDGYNFQEPLAVGRILSYPIENNQTMNVQLEGNTNVIACSSNRILMPKLDQPIGIIRCPEPFDVKSPVSVRCSIESKKYSVKPTTPLYGTAGFSNSSDIRMQHHTPNATTTHGDPICSLFSKSVVAEVGLELSDQKEYTVIKEAYSRLHENLPHLKPYGIIFSEYTDEYGKKRNIVTKRVDLSDHPEQVPLNTQENMLLIFCLISSFQKERRSSAMSIVVFPLIYQRCYQYNRFYKMFPESISKCDGYYLLYVNLIIRRTFRRVYSTKKNFFIGEFIFPADGAHVDFFRETILMKHCGQKLLAHLIVIKDETLRFTFYKASEDILQGILFRESQIIRRCQRFVDYKTKAHERFISSREYGFVMNSQCHSPSTANFCDIEPMTLGERLLHNSRLQFADYFSIKSESETKTQSESHICSLDSTLTECDIANLGKKLEFHKESSIVIKAISRLHRNRPDLKLFEFKFENCTDGNGRKTNMLVNIDGENDFSPRQIFQYIKNEMFFLFCLRIDDKTNKECSAISVVIVPMVYRGCYYQYDQFSSMSPEFIIKCDGYFLLLINLIIRRTSMKVDKTQKNICVGEFIFPADEKHAVFLKETILMLHFGQKLLATLATIKEKTLWFSFYKASDDKELEECLQKSALIAEGKKFIKYKKETHGRFLSSGRISVSDNPGGS